MASDSDRQRFRRLQDLFDGALELSNPERQRYLQENCRDDTSLRDEVEQLLAAAEGNGPLDLEIDQLAPSLADEASSALDSRVYGAGRKVGPWRIVEGLGRGGMGQVFVAERADSDFDQRVALKILRWEMASSEFAQRFRREQAILAALEHPGIARLVDGGVTDDGLPYLATELVAGKPITTFCCDHDLDVPARLELFVQVCDALDFAHRNLVVHRDIKPSNILIDPDRRVRLLDFGIAKILSETPSIDVTRTQPAPATLATAAPEQLRGGSVTTAADVWGLGVLLYELLTDARPFDRGDKNSVQIAQDIAEQTPPLPSDLAPAKRRSAVRGDLDNIILCALRKDPEARYSSVAALAEDVRRHQRGLPVSARGDSWSYRASKFLRRHIVGVSTAALVLGAVATLTTFYTWRLANERDRATQAALQTEEVTEFMLSMFEVNDPTISKGDELTARQILDRGAQRIDEELSDQPQLRAEMHATVAHLYQTLGVYDEADRHFTQSADLQRAVHGERSTEVAQVLSRRGFILGELDRLEEASDVLREAVSIFEQSDDRQALALARNQLGMTLSYRGEYGDAEPLLRQALDAQTELLGPENGQVATTMSNLGLTLKWKGDSDSAEPLYREALKIRRKLYGNDFPDVAVSLDNLGVLLGQRGDYEESEACFREALAIRQRLLGERHPDVALNLNNLATLFRVQGRLDEAEPIYRQVLELNTEIHGPTHRHVATNLANLGSVLISQEKFAEASKLLERALAIRKESLGEGHIRVALTQSNLVGALLRQGRTREAESLARTAVATARAAVEPEHRSLGVILRGHGEALVGLGRAQEAEGLLREALAIQTKALEPGHREIATTTAVLGMCLAAKGDDSEAENQLLAAYETLSKQESAKSWRAGSVRGALYALYQKQGRAQAAQAYAPEGP